MIGNKWLSEAVHTEEFEKGTMNFVVASTGCGKTKWATEHHSKTVTMPCKMLLLIDTRNGNDQIVHHNKEKVSQHTPSRDVVVISDKPTFFGEVKGTERITAMTYANYQCQLRNGYQY